MANEEQIGILRKGVDTWNKWRIKYPAIKIDLSGVVLNEINLRGVNLSEANLSNVDFGNAYLREARFFKTNLNGAKFCAVDLIGAKLNEANLIQANFNKATLIRANLSKAKLIGAKFIGTNLREANLIGANLWMADLCEADLRRVYFSEADLREADLRQANLCEAHLDGADLREADLSRADLSEAHLNGADLRKSILIDSILKNTDLSWANLSEVDFEGATLVGCNIYAISAWGLKLNDKTTQRDLIITPPGESIITVDGLEVAQFVYLLIHNEKIRDVIRTVSSIVVLILGRFSDIRKPLLEALKIKLRERGYLPILFDFDRSENRDIGETVSLLAHMARFVIADLTDAKSIGAELQLIVPNLPSVPVQPLILGSDYEYALFETIKRYKWVLPTHKYNNQTELLTSLEAKVIKPAEDMANECIKELERKRIGH